MRIRRQLLKLCLLVEKLLLQPDQIRPQRAIPARHQLILSHVNKHITHRYLVTRELHIAAMLHG